MKGSKSRNHHGYCKPFGTGATCQRCNNIRCDVLRLRYLGKPKYSEINQVDGGVETDYAQHAEYGSPWDVSLRSYDFPADRAQCTEPVVSEHHWYKCRQESSYSSRRRRRRNQLGVDAIVLPSVSPSTTMVAIAATFNPVRTVWTRPALRTPK